MICKRIGKNKCDNSGCERDRTTLFHEETSELMISVPLEIHIQSDIPHLPAQVSPHCSLDRLRTPIRLLNHDLVDLRTKPTPKEHENFNGDIMF